MELALGNVSFSLSYSSSLGTRSHAGQGTSYKPDVGDFGPFFSGRVGKRSHDVFVFVLVLFCFFPWSIKKNLDVGV